MSAQTVEVQASPVLGDLTYDTTPAGLTPAELIHYRKGYDRGSRAYLKKNGGPAVVHEAEAPRTGTDAHRALVADLADKGRQYRAERHAPAHKAGMSALRSYLRKTGQDTRLAEIVDPLAPVKSRKPATRKAPAKSRKLAAVPDVAPVETPEVPDALAAGIESGRVILAVVTDAPATVPAPMPPMTWAARKATRREIAAKLRAQGIRPTGDAWRDACRAAGLVSDEVSA